MKNGDLIECKALDTQYNSSREECIKVISKGIESDVIIEKISKLEVCIENPHFKQISFS
jgi:Rho-binding antiterminator